MRRGGEWKEKEIGKGKRREREGRRERGGGKSRGQSRREVPPPLIFQNVVAPLSAWRTGHWSLEVSAVNCIF